MVGGVCVYGVIVLIGMVWWGALLLQRGKLRESAAMRQREMLHAERLAAIEKDLPPPDSLEVPEDWVSPELERSRARWLLRGALGLGLLSATTGAGMCAAFYFAPDRGFNEMWTIGLIPFLAGVGCLVFWILLTEQEEK